MLVPLICGALLAYGYWRATIRAYINMSVVDAAGGARTEPLSADLKVRDATGNVLALGRSDGRFGIVRFAHPEFGSCEDEENATAFSIEARRRWQNCNSKKLHWQAKWAARVRLLDIRFGDCELTGLSLELRRRRDEWWLWWVPLPHIGGDPLTEFSAKIVVRTNPCQARIAGIYE